MDVASNSGIDARLRRLEDVALRGDPGLALTRLEELSTGDPVLLAEHAMLFEWLGGDAAPALRMCDRALAVAADPASRGRVLWCRGKISTGEERRRAFASALTQFGLARDDAGRALVLGELAFPHDDDGDVSLAYRYRLGADGLRLALACGDAHATLVCTGNLAACETYLGDPAAMDRWRASVEVAPSRLDARIAPVVSLNYLNWSLTATGYGDYAAAVRTVKEGAALARGQRWEALFAAVEAVILLRRGWLGAAADAAAKTAGDATAEAIATVVRTTCAVERSPRPDVTGLDQAVAKVMAASEQIGAYAVSEQARIRSVRREPEPARGLPPALTATMRLRRLFGWEDLVVVAAELRPDLARHTLAELAGVWPVGPRADAALRYVDGLLGSDGDALVDAGEAFSALPDPLAAGRAFAAAACLSATAAADLRQRAISLFQAAGAERSLAVLLRSARTRARIPTGQRGATNAGLTPREHEVAQLARRGLTGREIAEKLSLAEGTVRNHLLHIRDKLGGVPKRRLGEMFTEHLSD